MAGVAEQAFDAAAERRAVQRFDVCIAATVETATLAAMPVTVINISTHGFRLAADAALVPGEQVWLRLPGLLPTAGELVWRGPGMVSGAFATPLPLILLRRLVAAYPQVRSADPESAVSRSDRLSELLLRTRRSPR